LTITPAGENACKGLDAIVFLQFPIHGISNIPWMGRSIIVMPIKESNFMILVTGFGYQESMNASGILVKSLMDVLPEVLMPFRGALAFEVITCDETSRETEHQTLESQLSILLKRYKPDLCIHTGQAPPYNKITIEKIATNSFRREIIDPKRPVAYRSNLPGTDELSSVLEQEGIPACYSFNCGQHTCNHILFSSLYFSELDGGSHKAGFIHIPVLPEQVMKEWRDSPYMPLEMSRNALSLIIGHVAKAYGHNQSLNLTRGADAPLAG
jgi:pyroglutamyl-peptidase